MSFSDADFSSEITTITISADRLQVEDLEEALMEDQVVGLMELEDHAPAQQTQNIGFNANNPLVLGGTALAGVALGAGAATILG